MTQQEQKIEVARAALEWVRDDMVLGVGTGSTVNCFIDALAESGIRLEAAVSSSEETTRRLQAIGVEVLDLNKEKNFFETRVTEYQTGGTLSWD